MSPAAPVRVLHIGQQKTGTTSLQSAARDQRAALREFGVSYPGTALNHSRPTSGSMGRTNELWRRPPSRAEWRELLTEIEKFRAALISYEQIVEADDQSVQRFADELGDGLHVVLSLRPLASLLPSIWQQYVKTSYAGRFEEWAAGVLPPRPGASPTPSFWVRHDTAAQVAQWASVVPPERMTVVIVDPAEPARLSAEVERLLEIPEGTLTPADDGVRSNRGLSAIETELVRGVNAHLREARIPRSDHHRLVTKGLVGALQSSRTPGDGEGKTLPSAEVVAAADIESEAAIATIREFGVNVVGDLDSLVVGEAPEPQPAVRAEPETVREIARLGRRGIQQARGRVRPPVLGRVPDEMVAAQKALADQVIRASGTVGGS